MLRAANALWIGAGAQPVRRRVYFNLRREQLTSGDAKTRRVYKTDCLLQGLQNFPSNGSSFLLSSRILVLLCFIFLSLTLSLSEFSFLELFV